MFIGFVELIEFVGLTPAGGRPSAEGGPCSFPDLMNPMSSRNYFL
jgi:hypothetical protein